MKKILRSVQVSKSWSICLVYNPEKNTSYWAWYQNGIFIAFLNDFTCAKMCALEVRNEVNE